MKETTTQRSFIVYYVYPQRRTCLGLKLDNAFIFLMESVKEFRDWFVSKCKVTAAAAILTGGTSGQDSKYGGNIVTPRSIPQFIVPCSGDVSRQSSEDKFSRDDDARSVTSDSSAPYSERNSPAVSLSGSYSCLALPKSPVMTRSAPVTPRQEHKPRIGTRNDRHSLTSIDTLRDDGSEQSIYTSANQSTYSLPRRSLDVIVTNTTQIPSLNYTTTQQKSPLLMRGVAVDQFGVSNSWTARDDYSGASASGVSGSASILSSVPGNGRHKRSASSKASAGKLTLPLNQNGPSSAHSSSPRMDPFPTISVSSPGVSCMEEGASKYSQRNRYVGGNDNVSPSAVSPHKNKVRGHNYYRRRSSLSDLNVDEANYLSGLASQSSGCKSAGPSPTPRRKFHKQNSPLIEQRPFNVVSPSSPISPVNRLELRNDNSLGRKRSVSQLQAHLVAEYGELKFSFQYLPEQKQLKILLIRAENLGGNVKGDSQINAFAKISLMPGKLQKKVTDTIKHSRNPVFNKEFYFQISQQDNLEQMHLKIKLMNRPKNLVPEFLGETCVHLSDYHLLRENRMWKDLGPKSSEADLGCIQTTILFQPWENRISATVEQAKGLRPNRITGTVDPYVRVELSLNGELKERHQTKIKKKCMEPVFGDKFMFCISPQPETMRCTAITFSVYDHERLRTDEMIGQVRLGFKATEDTELTQWREALQNPGEKITKWHHLMLAMKFN